MIADLVYPSDIAKYPEVSSTSSACNCGCQSTISENSSIWAKCPPPPPYPYPYYPPYPQPETPDVEIKKSSVESQICKLSKKAAAIKKMIENFQDKNKDAIIKIYDASYNFGSYKVISTDSSGEKTEEDSVYGETILQILNDELAAIKAKMKELAEDLDSEDASSVSTLEKTVTQS